ncbi:MAG: PPC domain-containing DNA-binding protein [Lentisphaeria bacterium]
MPITYQQINHSYFLRLDPGDEIISCVKKFCVFHKLRAGTIRGLGAVKSINLGFFEPTTKKYQQQTFEGAFEMTSLTGNISFQNEEVYLHMHATFAGSDYQVFGGHLATAVVSATVELCISKEEGQLNRVFHPQIGLNIWDF